VLLLTNETYFLDASRISILTDGFRQNRLDLRWRENEQDKLIIRPKWVSVSCNGLVPLTHNRHCVYTNGSVTRWRFIFWFFFRFFFRGCRFSLDTRLHNCIAKTMKTCMYACVRCWVNTRVYTFRYAIKICEKIWLGIRFVYRRQ